MGGAERPVDAVPPRLERHDVRSNTATDGWAAGKTLHYTTGAGGPDSEGVTLAELGSSAIYVATERDNNANNGVSRLSRPALRH